MLTVLCALLTTGCGVIIDPPDGGVDGGASACALPAGRYTLTWRLVPAESEGACAPIAPGELDAEDDPCPTGCTCTVEDSGEDGDCVRTLDRRCSAGGDRRRLMCSFPHDGDGTPFGGECTLTFEDSAGRTVARCVYDVTGTRTRE